MTEGYEAFDLSARYLPFPENALTIWREQDKLALSITRGPALVYYQSLGGGEITARVVQDISCAQATLAMQDILTPLQKMLLWTEVSAAEELTALKGALPLPIEQEECPPPVAPKQLWKLTPFVVGEARKRARQPRSGSCAALAHFPAGLPHRRGRAGCAPGDDLARRGGVEVNGRMRSGPRLISFTTGRSAWKELGPVVDDQKLPARVAARGLPIGRRSTRLHLTLFETGNNHLLIKGEAKNVAGAFPAFQQAQGRSLFRRLRSGDGQPSPVAERPGLVPN